MTRDTDALGAAIDSFLDGDRSLWIKSTDLHLGCGQFIWVLADQNDDRWPGYKMGICECRMIATLDGLLPPEKIGPRPPKPVAQV